MKQTEQYCAESRPLRCDLHTHSVFSDGTYTPAEIVAEAKRLGRLALVTLLTILYILKKRIFRFEGVSVNADLNLMDAVLPVYVPMKDKRKMLAHLAHLVIKGHLIV